MGQRLLFFAKIQRDIRPDFEDPAGEGRAAIHIVNLRDKQAVLVGSVDDVILRLAKSVQAEFIGNVGASLRVSFHLEERSNRALDVGRPDGLVHAQLDHLLGVLHEVNRRLLLAERLHRKGLGQRLDFSLGNRRISEELHCHSHLIESLNVKVSADALRLGVLLTLVNIWDDCDVR